MFVFSNLFKVMEIYEFIPKMNGGFIFIKYDCIHSGVQRLGKI